MSGLWMQACADRINLENIPHFEYQITKNRLISETLVRKGGECIALTGPSRIGKTSIAEALAESLNPSFKEDLLKLRPVVHFTCRNRGDKGLFTTKAFYLDALESINHPIFTVDGVDLLANFEMIRRLDRATNASLEAVLENALKVLRTKYLIIDETQHMKYMVGGDKSALQMLEFFKTLAEKLNIILIFVGAYPIVNVLQLSPHLLGRIHTIEMKRYYEDSDSDQRRFKQIILSLSSGIVLEKNVESLLDWSDELFDGSLGVIGLVAAWVRNAIAEAMARGDTELSLEHIRYTRKPQLFLDEMLLEIEAGELYMKPKKFNYRSAGVSSKNTKGKKKRGKKTRPFQAKVKRRGKGERN